SLRSSFLLPAVLYAVPVLIAAYLLSPKEVAGTALLVIFVASLNVILRQMSLWLAVSHLLVVASVGLLSTALASKRVAESRLAEERGRLTAQVRESEKLYRQIVETAQEGIWAIDADDKTTFANSAICAMLGYAADEMLGLPLFAFMDDEARASAAAYLERRRAGIKETHDFQFRRKDGTDLWAIVSTNPLFDETGHYAGALGMITDITERRRVEESLRESHEVVKALIGASPLAIIASDLAGNVTLWNSAAERIFGWSEHEVIGRPSPIVPPERREEYRSIQSRLERGEVFNVIERSQLRKDGSLMETSLWTTVLRDGKDEVSGFMALIADTTEQKRAEEERERLIAIVEATSDFVAISDADQRITYINQAGRRMLDVGPDENVSERMIIDNHPARESSLIREKAIPTAISGGIWTGEASILGRNGKETPVSQVILSHKAPNGQVRFLSTIARDISEHVQHEEQLAYLANHDHLTGLANRRLLEETMNRTTARARRGVQSILLFMDLDNFKAVNDTLSHAAGDEVLVKIAKLLESQLRTEDLLVRVGGDEFAVLLEGTGVEEAHNIAGRLCSVVRDFVVDHDSGHFIMGLSIGLAVIDGQRAPLEVSSLADAAMYQAKEQGGDRVVLYST
ncbi:MAG: PAS domain S-box protein, partial [Dehalococcoidia bacterium]|nr:PAS domain S-box protein [Dehalococcoidia bacterium]